MHPSNIRYKYPPTTIIGDGSQKRRKTRILQYIHQGFNDLDFLCTAGECVMYELLAGWMGACVRAWVHTCMLHVLLAIYHTHM